MERKRKKKRNKDTETIVNPEIAREKEEKEIETRACLKIHSCHLHASLCGIFVPNSVSVAHYAAFICNKSPTKCDIHLAESNFRTRSRKKDFHDMGGFPRPPAGGGFV